MGEGWGEGRATAAFRFMYLCRAKVPERGGIYCRKTGFYSIFPGFLSLFAGFYA